MTQVLCGLSGSPESAINVYEYSTGKLLKNHTKPGCFVSCFPNDFVLLLFFYEFRKANKTKLF